MKNLFNTIAAIALSLPMIIFGLNKFLLFANVAPPTDKTAQMFLGAMFTSYLAKIVGITEIIGGGLVLLSKTRTLGWFLLLPIMANIIVFHFAHDMPGNMIWLFSTAAFILVAFFEKTSIYSTLKASLK